MHHPPLRHWRHYRRNRLLHIHRHLALRILLLLLRILRVRLPHVVVRARSWRLWLLLLLVRVIDGLCGVLRACTGARGAAADVDSGRGSVGEEAAEVVALDDLGHGAGFDVADLDEGGLEGEDVGVVESWKKQSVEFQLGSRGHDEELSSPKAVGHPSQCTIKSFLDRHPFRLI